MRLAISFLRRTGAPGRGGWAPPGGDPVPRWLLALWVAGPALVTALVGAGGAAGEPLGSAAQWWWIGASTVVAAALWLRLSWPLASWSAAVAVLVSSMAMGSPWGLEWLVLLAPALPLVAVAAAEPSRRSLTVAAITALAGTAVAAAQASPLSAVMPLAVAAGAWLAGYASYSRRRQAEELTARADRLEREREAVAAGARADERAALARELHDVVSHNVAVMVVQASAAQSVVAADAARAAAAMEAVERTGRAAMAELRTMLAALEDPDRERGTATHSSATPGLDRLEGVVKSSRAAGLDVHLDVRADAKQLPQPLATTALRVAQEGLTNTLRHAKATAAVVTVAVEQGALSVGVTDDGVGLAGSRAAHEPLDPAHRGRRGLAGLRQRVTLLGGELDVGEAEHGGTTIRARLPLSGGGDVG